MEYKINGSSLDSIALELEIDINELIEFHNLHCSMTQSITSDYIPLHIEDLYIRRKDKGELFSADEFTFADATLRARYRCELSNVILIDSKPSFSSQTKTEYFLDSLMGNRDKSFIVELQDYVSAILPNELTPAFDLIKEIEFIRNRVVFTHDSEGKIAEILNLSELSSKWQHFINKDADNIPFFKELKNSSPEVIDDFIVNGNKEFSNSHELSAVLNKNLFYHILLEANSKEKSDFDIIQNSQLFPNILLKINVVKSIISQGEDFTTYRLVGTLIENLDDLHEIAKLYKEMYQPIIKYNYTEFAHIYRITYTINNKSGILTSANASIKEHVKNNYGTTTKYDLRSIEL